MIDEDRAKKRKKIILGILLLLILLFAFLLVKKDVNSPKLEACSKANNCQYLSEFAWELNLETKSVKRIRKDSEPEPFYDNPSGLENARLEVVDEKGVVRYKRNVSISPFTYYDYIGKDGKLTGGIINAKTMIFNSYLPYESSWGSEKLYLRLIDIKTKSTYAQGQL